MKKTILVSFLIAVLWPITSAILAAPTPQDIDRLLNTLTYNKNKKSVRLSKNKKGFARFLGAPPSSFFDVRRFRGNKPEETARGFLNDNRKLFGLVSKKIKLKAKRVKDTRKYTFVRFQQVYDDIPIWGAEINVQLQDANGVISVLSDVMTDTIILDSGKLVLRPAISASEAKAIAIGFLSEDLPGFDLRATEPALAIYGPSVVGNSGPVRLVWQLNILDSTGASVNEFTLIDAHIGEVALHFSEIMDAKSRRVYDADNTSSDPGTLMREDGEAASGIEDVDRAYDYLGDTYDFYNTHHGRDSLNNAGLTLSSTVRFCNNRWACPMQNAYWNGNNLRIYLGEEFSVDDVVAHEYTHGVTQYESDLIYLNESGAINESFSDIWGEFVDLENGSGTDTPTVRWRIGEDLPIGAIRDMASPRSFGDPDRMSSPFYYTGSNDNGGVHTNSGVNNKLCYLLTDGDTFNGQTVTGMGISDVAQLYYEVQTNLLTSSAEYTDLYNALTQAAINLDFTESERENLERACLAVEISIVPQFIPYAQDFSSGEPDNLEGWQYYSNNDGRIEVVSGELRMDDTTNGSAYSLNEAILHLDLSGQSRVTLTLDHVNSNDENNGLPSSFTGHSDGDGIAISADGTNWYLLTNLTSSFTDESFDLDSAIQLAGISYTTDFRIKFQQYDNYSWSTDGRSFDNISVTPKSVPDIASHVYLIEIDTFWDYNNPTNPDNLSYVFYFAAETDETVDSVEVNTPAGYTFAISNDVNTQSGEVQTWHYSDSSTHFWEYEGKFADQNNLTNYGDGTYTITVHYENGGQAETTVLFGQPNTGAYIPQPTQEPVLTFPAHNGTTTSPITFTWQDCNDANVTSISIALEKQDNNDTIVINCPNDATSSDPCWLSMGVWEAQLCFDHWYDFNNVDSIPVEIGKYSESDYTFTVTTSPIAHWTMDDDAENTTVLDSSGNGNDGTAQQNTEDISTSGIIDGALTFNGTSDYVDCGDDSNLDFGTGDFSICMWMKTSSSLPMRLVNKRDSSNVGYEITTNTSGLIRAGIGNSSGYTQALGRSVNDNSWHHVAITYDRDGNVSLYVDAGTPSTTDISSRSGSIDNSESFRIGRLRTPDKYFQGTIDDVKLFNKVLSDDDIATLYSDGTATLTVPDVRGQTQADAEANIVAATFTVGSVTTAYSDTVAAGNVISQSPAGGTTAASRTSIDLVVSLGPIPSGVLVAHWTMDNDAENTTVLDSSGNGNDGTAQQNTEDISTAGIIDDALTFNGTSDYIDCGDDSNLDFGTGDFSVSLWMKTSSSLPMRLINKRDSSNVGYEITTNTSGLIRAGIGDSSGYTQALGGSVNDNSWHHVAITYDRDGNVSLYVDADTPSTTDISSRSGSLDNSESFRIGRLRTPDKYFQGAIDDVKLFNKVLSDDDIATLYSDGTATLTVPDVTGQTQATAEANILAATFTVGSVTTVNSDTVAAGNVISQSPAGGTTAASRTSIDLVVSLGPIPSGVLVAHWTMDNDAENTTVLDSSGNGNDGTAQQNTEDISTAGIIDDALTFNGTSDYIDCGDDSNLDFGTGDFSVSLWMKTSSSLPMRLVNKRDSSNVGYEITTNTSGQIRAGIGDSSGYTQALGGSVNDNSWHHVAITYDRDGSVSLYVDAGTPSTTDISSRSGSLDNSESFRIGRLRTPDKYFQGTIDDVKLFNKVLSAVEIEALYDEGGGVGPVESFTPSEAVPMKAIMNRFTNKPYPSGADPGDFYLPGNGTDKKIAPRGFEPLLPG